jgi:hypothetical protein
MLKTIVLRIDQMAHASQRIEFVFFYVCVMLFGTSLRTKLYATKSRDHSNASLVILLKGVLGCNSILLVFKYK